MCPVDESDDQLMQELTKFKAAPSATHRTYVASRLPQQPAIVQPTSLTSKTPRQYALPIAAIEIRPGALS